MTSAHRTYQFRGYCTRAGHDRPDDVMGEFGRLYDASRVDPVGRREAALQTLAEFMADLPEAGSRLLNKNVAPLGKAIYERDICHLVEPDHDGEYVAIDVDSGKWALGEDVRDAVDNLREMQPEAINVLLERAGYRVLYSFGAGSLRKPR